MFFLFLYSQPLPPPSQNIVSPFNTTQLPWIWLITASPVESSASVMAYRSVTREVNTVAYPEACYSVWAHDEHNLTLEMDVAFVHLNNLKLYYACHIHVSFLSRRSIPIFPPFPFASGIILLGLCWGRVLGEVMIFGLWKRDDPRLFCKNWYTTKKSWNICFKGREYCFLTTKGDMLLDFDCSVYKCDDEDETKKWIIMLRN